LTAAYSGLSFRKNGTYTNAFVEESIYEYMGWRHGSSGRAPA
jgi:hypothetical protein